MNRIRENKHTESDVDLIASKVTRNEDLKDYPYVYSRNVDVNEHNNNFLSKKT